MDISKAYDRMEWDYLEKLLIQIGFAQRLVKLTMMCEISETQCYG